MLPAGPVGDYGIWMYKACLVPMQWLIPDQSRILFLVMANRNPCDLGCQSSESVGFWYPDSLELAVEVRVCLEASSLEPLTCVLPCAKEALKV